MLCVEKDGGFIRQFPPLGDTLRNLLDAAASSDKNPWGISDCECHTREMQGVKCQADGIFAQDHTFETVKNCPKRIQATALWDVVVG